jgi:hypothetical protein
VYGQFSAGRPAGLRRRSLPAGTGLWRIDATEPDQWDWDGFPTPLFRFDPASGAFRSRYASTSIDGAAREWYLDTGRLIPADHAGHYLVRLTVTRPLKVLDLRTQANLDALDIDDRINASHEEQVWDACHRLADAVRGWWDDHDGIVYRSRTAPQTSHNIALFSLGGLTVEDSRPLDACVDELDNLVLQAGFTIEFPY